MFLAGLLGWSGLCNNVWDNQVSLPGFRSWCYPCTQSGRCCNSYSSGFKVGVSIFLILIEYWNWWEKYQNLIHILLKLEGMNLFCGQHFTFLVLLSRVDFVDLVFICACDSFIFLNESCYFYKEKKHKKSARGVRWSLTKIKLAITAPVAFTLTGRPADI